MEAMHIHMRHVFLDGRHCTATAHVIVKDADIRMAVGFICESRASTDDLIEQARDEILRYLDIL